VAGVTTHPNWAWVADVAWQTIPHLSGPGCSPGVVVTDRDTKFGPELDTALAAHGLTVKRLKKADGGSDNQRLLEVGEDLIDDAVGVAFEF
jgi:hypothetical protein